MEVMRMDSSNEQIETVSLRTFAGSSVEFRTNPERLVAVSPVHEYEINVAGSIGDYNYYMVLGFRSYLLSQYGSVEKDK